MYVNNFWLSLLKCREGKIQDHKKRKQEKYSTKEDKNYNSYPDPLKLRCIFCGCYRLKTKNQNHILRRLKCRSQILTLEEEMHAPKS